MRVVVVVLLCAPATVVADTDTPDYEDADAIEDADYDPAETFAIVEASVVILSHTNNAPSLFFSLA